MARSTTGMDFMLAGPDLARLPQAITQVGKDMFLVAIGVLEHVQRLWPPGREIVRS